MGGVKCTPRLYSPQGGEDGLCTQRCRRLAPQPREQVSFEETDNPTRMTFGPRR
jgi:hypothetical protein